jgi:hypothetical protein
MGVEAMRGSRCMPCTHGCMGRAMRACSLRLLGSLRGLRSRHNLLHPVHDQALLRLRLSNESSTRALVT